MKEQSMSDEKAMGQVVQIDEAQIRNHFGEMVRCMVPVDTNAASLGRSPGLEAINPRGRGVLAKSISCQTFETAIIERHRRRESSRRVEDITEARWSTRVTQSTLSNLNMKIHAKLGRTGASKAALMGQGSQPLSHSWSS
jgi:putative transposase